MSLWIEKAARRQAGKQLALAAAVLVVIAAAMASNMDYLRSYFAGARNVSASELVTDRVGLGTWIQVNADKLMPTGVQEIRVRKKRGVERGREVSAEFFVAEIGEKFLLIKGVPGQTSKLEGTLVPMNHEAFTNVIGDAAKAAAVRPRFMTHMMDTHDFGSSAGNWLPVAGFVALGALFWGGMGLARWRNPSSHPAVKALAKNDQLASASNSIARDLGTNNARTLGQVTLTRHFLVRQTWHGLDIKPLTDLLWAYKQVVKRKIYYVIPAGQTFGAAFNFDKLKVAVSGKEADVDEALAWSMQHAPWTAYGHSDELAAVYKNQRKELQAHVKAGIERARADAAIRAQAEAAKAKVLKAMAAEQARAPTARDVVDQTPTARAVAAQAPTAQPVSG